MTHRQENGFGVTSCTLGGGRELRCALRWPCPLRGLATICLPISVSPMQPFESAPCLDTVPGCSPSPLARGIDLEEDRSSISEPWGPSNVFFWVFILYNLQRTVFVPLNFAEFHPSSPPYGCSCRRGQAHLEDPFKEMLSWEKDLFGVHGLSFCG